VEVLFSVSEGEPTRIAEISIGGNPGIPLNRILDTLEVDLSSILDLEQLSAGLEKLKLLYRREHYYRARVGEPVIRMRANGAPSASSGQALVALPISAGPQYSIRLHGNRNFRDQVLLGVLAYDGTETLDRAVIGKLRRRLVSFYQYRGFGNAHVEARETRSPDTRRAVLAFDIEEGLPVAVSEIVFVGNREIPTSELREAVADSVQSKSPVPSGEIHPTDDPLELEGRTATSARAAEPDPEPTRVFVEEAYRDAADAMTLIYRDRGFLDGRVRLASFEVDARGTAFVRFEVSEGTRTYLSKIRYLGVPPRFEVIPPRLRVGDPLSRSAVERARGVLIDDLGHKGYLFAKVEAVTELSADRKTAELVFQLTPGPQVHIGQIILQGLNRTQPQVVRANLQLQSGAVLDPNDLFETQRNLVVLGIFRQVEVHLISPETMEPVKDVVVEVKEMPRLDGNVLGGYSLVDGPQVGGDVLYPNLGGLGINLFGHAKMNYVGLSGPGLAPGAESDLHGITGLGGRGTIELQDPRIYSLLPVKLGARLALVGERVFRPSYRFTRFASVLGTDWTAFKWLTLSLQYEIEHDSVQAGPNLAQLLPSLNFIDQERLRFPVGIFNLHSLRQSLVLDFRDDILDPHRGMLFSGFAEATHDLGAFKTDSAGNRISAVPVYTLKIAGNLTFYVPLARRVVLALSARAGRIFRLDRGSETIAPKRFFLGGSSSIRGFREDGLIPSDTREQLHRDVTNCRSLASSAGCTLSAAVLLGGNEIPSEGGELFELGKAELRFPGIAPFDFAVFFEAGNLWSTYIRGYQPLNLRYSTGAGIRYVTPVGPLALDLGFNLAPDSLLNESAVQVHFSIGLF
jgi:outer membrane protein assembly factor BamA